MTLSELLAVLIAAGAGGLLWTSLRAREVANAAMRTACRAEGLLFLDDTVALESMRPARDREGRVTLRRIYGFDYSDTGDNRRRGKVTLLGARIVAIEMHRPNPVGQDDAANPDASRHPPAGS
jgi:Protein of unknown function (DUF3301)